MTDLGGGARQFELIDDLHHHLICHRCGAILELDDALVDPLRDGIRDRYGFALAIDHLAVFGFCSVCARVGRSAMVIARAVGVDSASPTSAAAATPLAWPRSGASSALRWRTWAERQRGSQRELPSDRVGSARWTRFC